MCGTGAGGDVCPGSEWGRPGPWRVAGRKLGRKGGCGQAGADLAWAVAEDGRSGGKWGQGCRVTWWYHVLAVGPGRPRPPREVLAMSRRHGSLLTGICCWLSNIPGLFWEPWGRGTPRSAQGPCLPSSWFPAGSAPASGIPTPTPILLECLVHGAGWGHHLVAGPFRPGRLCGEQAGQASRAPSKGDVWGHGSSGGPPTPKPQSCLRPTGPPPPGPAPGAPSSLRRPPGPWHGGSLLPTTTSGSR